MATITTIQSCKSLDSKEDFIIDLDVKIYETSLMLKNLTEIKKQVDVDPKLHSR